jgi:O-antigen/teichoic acid export membrane protein
MLRNKLFFLMMGGGAILGLLRGFAVAGILTASGFGYYATLLAVGVFLAPLFGFGQIEVTRKVYPRLFVDGSAHLIPSHSDSIAVRLAHRIAGLVGMVMLVCVLAGETRFALAGLAVGLVAFGNGWCSVLASALRASAKVQPLGEATLARSALAASLAVGGAYLHGMEGAIAGEALGALLGGFVLRIRLRRMSGPAPETATAAAPSEEFSTAQISWDGMRIFGAALAISVPVYLSRPVVGLFYSPEELGTFSFLMLFIMVSVTIFGVTDQVIGPGLVRGQRQNNPFGKQIAYLFKVSGALAVLVGCGVAIAFFVLQFEPLAAFAQKYQYDLATIVPIVILATAQVTSTFDWMLQAHDRERIVLNAAILGLSLFVVGTVAAYSMNFGLAGFIWVMAVARLAQLVFQIGAILQLGRSVTCRVAG